MNITPILPALDKSTMPAAQYEYVEQIIAIAQRALAELSYAVSLSSDASWSGNDNATIEQRIKALGTSAQLFLTFHGQAVALLNSVAEAVNDVAPNTNALIPPMTAGTIAFNADGSVLSFTPTPPTN